MRPGGQRAAAGAAGRFGWAGPGRAADGGSGRRGPPALGWGRRKPWERWEGWGCALGGGCGDGPGQPGGRGGGRPERPRRGRGSAGVAGGQAEAVPAPSPGSWDRAHPRERKGRRARGLGAPGQGMAGALRGCGAQARVPGHSVQGLGKAGSGVRAFNLQFISRQ